jgi:hypothetical protein
MCITKSLISLAVIYYIRISTTTVDCKMCSLPYGLPNSNCKLGKFYYNNDNSCHTKLTAPMGFRSISAFKAFNSKF